MNETAPLTSGQIAGLRSRAQKLDAILKIGKQGLTPSFLASVSVALDQHELIKVKFVDHKDEKKELAPQLAQSTQSVLVTRIGNVVVLFRQHSDPAKRTMVL
jgi:RNA-binding protein